MKKKIHFKVMIMIALFLSVFSANDRGNCICIETGKGGTVSSGKMSRSQFTSFVERMIDASVSNSNVKLFQYQGKDAFYAKVCDNEKEIQKLKSKFGIQSISPDCEMKCLTLEELAVRYAGKEGLLILEIGDPCEIDKYLWRIYKYKK